MTEATPTDAPAARAFAMCVRVYYEDTDAGGIVYHANWLRWMERVRTDWLRSLGARHGEIARRDGLLFVVADLAIRYRQPARLDDLLRVDLQVTEARRASLRLSQRAWRVATPDGAASDAPLIEAQVRVAAMRRDSGRPVPLPDWLLNRLDER